MQVNNSIKNKLGNLINVSLRDTSIFVNLNSTHLDLSKYIDAKSIYNFFSGNLDKLEININTDDKELLKLLNNSNDANHFLQIIEQYNIYIPNTKIKLLQSDFNSYKNTCTDIAVDYINNLKQNISYVERKAKEIKNDKGSWNLYFTKYFLVGKTPNKKAVIKSPILFFNIEIQFIKEQSKFIISKADNFLVLNEKLIIYLLRDANKENRLLSEFDSIKSIEDFIEKVNKIIGININFGNKKDLSFFNKKSKEIASNYGELLIEDGTSFGIYEPIGGKLKQDLEEIINKKDVNVIFETSNIVSNEEIQSQELQEDPLIQIGKLDLYQKFAVRSSILQNTIIHGPPGTGKSEVISNIIANILLKGKSAMMISEKKAALDVLEKRLKSLDIFMLQMYDNNDKESFYNNIVNIDRFLGNSWLSHRQLNFGIELQTNSTYIENKKLSNNFIKRINALLNFENFTFHEYDYHSLNQTIVKLWQDKELFLKIKNDNILLIFENYSEKLKLSYEQLFDLVDNFSKFILANHLSSQTLFLEFKREVDNFLKYKNDFNFDINNVDKIIQIKKYSEFLSKFLANNLGCEQALRNNPYLFYNAILVVKKLKKLH